MNSRFILKYKIRFFFIQNLRVFINYIKVGLINNIIGYLLYLLGTLIGLSPIFMITCLYSIVIISSFILNKKYTFQVKGNFRKTFIKFIFINISAYLINYLFLYYAMLNNISHQLVQFFAIIFIGTYMFILSKYFVFK